MTLTEYVDEVTNDADVRGPEWFPSGWMIKKKSPVHVEDHKNEDEVVALCGVHLDDGHLSVGPARALLRRSEGCKNCERALDG